MGQPERTWRVEADEEPCMLRTACELRGWRRAAWGEVADLVWTDGAACAMRAAALARAGRVSCFADHENLTREELLTQHLEKTCSGCRAADPSQCAASPLLRAFHLPQEQDAWHDDLRGSSSGVAYSLHRPGEHLCADAPLVRRLHDSCSGGEVATQHPQAGVPSMSCSEARDSGRASSTLGPAAAWRMPEGSWVARRWPAEPLLLAGRTPQLRLYVLLLSVQPLVAYISDEGTARMPSSRRTSRLAHLDSGELVESTSVEHTALPRQGNGADGWSLDALRVHLESTRGTRETSSMFARLRVLVAATLRAGQQGMAADPCAFQLLAFDLLLDSKLQPWLSRVEAAPSLAAVSREGQLRALRIIHDALMLALPDDGCAADGTNAGAARRPARVGSMQLLADDGGLEGPGKLPSTVGDRARAGDGAAATAGDAACAGGTDASARARELRRRRAVLHG